MHYRTPPHATFSICFNLNGLVRALHKRKKALFFFQGNGIKFYEERKGGIASFGFDAVEIQVYFLEKQYWWSSHRMI